FHLIGYYLSVPPVYFFLHAPAPTEDYTLSLHDALPILGGGPTGVELSGALAEMKKIALPKDYPDKDFSKLNVFLIEGSPNTLNVMSDMAKKYSQKYLEDLGVKVLTNAYVDSYDGEVVTLKSGESIKTKNLIWAAGVVGNSLQ